MTGRHRPPSPLRRMRDAFRYWSQRPERLAAAATCGPCNGKPGQCECLEDCGDEKCTGEFS